MNRESMLTIGITTAWLSVLGGLATSAEDKYSVRVRGGLAFSEFRGYESWQAISISRNDRVVAAILGNPAMIDAYEAGFPGNGKPVPDGAKMAKLESLRRFAGRGPIASRPSARGGNNAPSRRPTRLRFGRFISRFQKRN